MRCSLKECEWLTGLAPRVVATPGITFEIFGCQEAFCAVVGEEFWAETDLCCEIAFVWLGVCKGERVFAVVGFFTSDDEFKLEAVAAVAARVGLDPAVHFTCCFAIDGFKIVLETLTTLV